MVSESRYGWKRIVESCTHLLCHVSGSPVSIISPGLLLSPPPLHASFLVLILFESSMGANHGCVEPQHSTSDTHTSLHVCPSIIHWRQFLRMMEITVHWGVIGVLERSRVCQKLSCSCRLLHHHTVASILSKESLSGWRPCSWRRCCGGRSSTHWLLFIRSVGDTGWEHVGKLATYTA